MEHSTGLSAVPLEMRERKQWVVWKREQRKGKWTKPPYCAFDPWKPASTTDPGTWGTFEQAMAATAAQGTGYVFADSDPYTGVDLDACIDVQTGEIHPDAAEILQTLGGYQERSPSEAGMHAIVRAKLNGDRHKTGKTPWGGGFEVYDKERFFTVTGNGGGAIDERQAEVDTLVARMFAASSQNGSGPPPADEPAQDESARSLEELFEEFPEMKRIAAHTGTAPKDTSASGWDFYLCCEGVRCECTDAEIALLIRHARRDDAKSARDDYVDKTIKAARKTVAKDATDPAKRISRQWGLAKDPVVGGETLGDIASGAAIVYLTLRSGRTLRFPRVGDLFEPRKHNRLVGLIARTEFSRLTENQCHDITLAIIDLCGGVDDNPHDEARQWVSDFLHDVGDVVAVKLDPVKGEDDKAYAARKWDALMARENAEMALDAVRKPSDVARRAVAMRDEKERLWPGRHR